MTTGTLWLERVEPPTLLRKVAYRLVEPVPFDGGATEWVVASWGRSGDAALFPGRADGAILDFRPLRTADWWMEHDSLLGEWLEADRG